MKGVLGEAPTKVVSLSCKCGPKIIFLGHKWVKYEAEWNMLAREYFHSNSVLMLDCSQDNYH